MNSWLVRHLYGFTKVLVHRLPMVLICIALFVYLGYSLDRYKVEHASAKEFIEYYDFTVSNARDSEDVFFKVCRKHKGGERYSGTLRIFVVTNPEKPEEQQTKIYSKSGDGVLASSECENKVLKQSDFHHVPGAYKMTVSLCLTVKYDFQKCVEQDSNIYRIYPQPEDIEGKIRVYEERLQQLQQQLRDSGASTGTPLGQMSVQQQANPTPDQTEDDPPPPPSNGNGLVPDFVPILGRF